MTHPSLIPKSNSKPNIRIDTTIQNKDNNYFGIDVKKIFKATSSSKISKSQRTNNEVTNRNNTPTYKSKTKRSYIKYIEPKVTHKNGITTNNNNNNINIINNNEETEENNKIKTQINLFVKQLNYNSHYNSEQNNTKHILPQQNAHSNVPLLNTNSMYNFTFNNNNSENDFTQNNNDIEQLNQLNINDIKTLRKTLTSLSVADLQRIPSDYVYELKDLAKIISNLFGKSY